MEMAHYIAYTVAIVFGATLCDAACDMTNPSNVCDISSGTNCIQYTSGVPLTFQSTCYNATIPQGYTLTTTFPICIDGVSQKPTPAGLSLVTLVSNISYYALSNNNIGCNVSAWFKGTLIGGWQPFSQSIGGNMYFATNVVLRLALDSGAIISSTSDNVTTYPGSGWMSSCSGGTCQADGGNSQCLSGVGAGAASVCSATNSTLGNPSVIYTSFYVVFAGTDSKGHQLTSENDNPMTFSQFSLNIGSLFGSVLAGAQNAWSSGTAKASELTNKITPTAIKKYFM